MRVKTDVLFKGIIRVFGMRGKVQKGLEVVVIHGLNVFQIFNLFSLF
jgi:hypothetical protein